MIFKICLPKKLAKNIGGFLHKIDHNIVFFKKTPSFSPKVGEN
jgi:hypothetical protein